MGAHYLQMFIKTKSKKVFDKKLEEILIQERSYHGTDPYSGSWTTISDFKNVSDPFPERKRWTKKKYQDVEKWLEDNTDKREAKVIKTSTGYIVGGMAAS
jgi:hypothetical protein